MVWFNVDDGFWSHPKVLELSADAVALWVRAGSYCAKHLTDGKVAHRTLRVLDGDYNAATELVIAGLWTFDDGENCWWFHDWTKYQRTRAQVEAERAAAAERMRAVRANKKANVRENERRTFADGSPSQSSPVQAKPGTTTKTSKSQSSSRRASVSTDSVEISEMTQRLSGQRGIQLPGIISAIAQRCGIDVTADQAWQVSLHLLDKAPKTVEAPQRYVLGCIDQSAAEVQQWLYEQGIAS